MTLESKLFGKLPLHVATDFHQLDTSGQVIVYRVVRVASRPGFWCCLCFVFILVAGTVLGGRAMTSLDEAKADQATYAIASPPPPMLYPSPQPV